MNSPATGSREVRQQYERFPYPPLPWPALPRRDQGETLRYAFGQTLNGQTDVSHRGIRILVAGCGTLEALVVAQNHPQAAEVVAVDLSSASLHSLKRRLRWARLRNAYTLAGLRGHGLPPVHLKQADLNEYSDGPFDYIVASNVLHHVADPAHLLSHLSGLLKPDGLMRVVTYPKHSRYWLQRTGDWLRGCGLDQDTPNLKQAATACINQLPSTHPIRSCFEAHSETRHVSGLVDAFLHSLEKPLSPLQWQRACREAGLALLGEAQHADARSDFLRELAPETGKLDSWTRLQIMDDLLELNTNPTWWFRKGINDGITALPGDFMTTRPAGSVVDRHVLHHSMGMASLVASLKEQPSPSWQLPSACFAQLGHALRRAEVLLQPSGLGVQALIDILRREVGPHLGVDDTPLPGLSIGEYETRTLLQAEEPLSDAQWLALQQAIGDEIHLVLDGQDVPGATLVDQARWLQLRYGPEQALIGPLQFFRA